MCMLAHKGRINLSGQSVHCFGGASTIFFTVETDYLFSHRCFNKL